MCGKCLIVGHVDVPKVGWVGQHGSEQTHVFCGGGGVQAQSFGVVLSTAGDNTTISDVLDLGVMK